jgi:hypothetical protein
MSKKKIPLTVWAIVDARTSKLMVFDCHVPIYWLRRAAQADANDHGCTTVGPAADVRIRRCEVRIV